MPNTRKRIIKTVYNDEDDSEAERNAGDFSDSGSDAKISEHSSSEDPDSEGSAEELDDKIVKSKKKTYKPPILRKKFVKELISNMNKLNKELPSKIEEEEVGLVPFSVKDLTDADKLLPSFLNLSESDTSDDESPKPARTQNVYIDPFQNKDLHSDDEKNIEYKDVWSQNLQDNSEDVARKTFMELEQNKTKVEETKASILSYTAKSVAETETNVNDLLALGEEALPTQSHIEAKKKAKKGQPDSDSEMDDWEEVKDAKGIPQQGIQLVVELPGTVSRKSKKLDIEMMMKRKINRVKKEYQIYMHKVHVLCWLGHGNYTSKVLNDQEVLAAVLALVPSKESYPGERIDIKYMEQITTWFKDKFTLKQEKYEDKFRPKAPPLNEILKGQVKTRVASTKKYMVYVFVSMLRALGLQCRVMFNFVTLPLKPPSSELCSLSTKPSETKSETYKEKKEVTGKVNKKIKSKTTTKIAQVDGICDNSSSDSETENIMQLDGNDDMLTVKTRGTRRVTTKKKTIQIDAENQDVSPPKRSRKTSSPKPIKVDAKEVKNSNEDLDIVPVKRKKITQKKQETKSHHIDGNDKMENIIDISTQTLNVSHNRRCQTTDSEKKENNLSETPVIKKPVNKNIPYARKTRAAIKDTHYPTKSDDNNENIVQVATETFKVTQNRRRQTTDSKKKENKTSAKPVKTNISNQRKTRVSSKDSHSPINSDDTNDKKVQVATETLKVTRNRRRQAIDSEKKVDKTCIKPVNKNIPSSRKTRAPSIETQSLDGMGSDPRKTYKITTEVQHTLSVPKITVTDEINGTDTSSKYFDVPISRPAKRLSLSRKRSQTVNPNTSPSISDIKADNTTAFKSRTKSAPGKIVEKSKYFDVDNNKTSEIKKPKTTQTTRKQDRLEDKQRVSHKDLHVKSKNKLKNDVTGDIVDIIKKRVKNAKEESRLGIVKGKVKNESDGDNDYLPEDVRQQHNSDSDEDFKPSKLSPRLSTSCKIPSKLSPRPSISRKIDRRVISSDDDTPKNKCDVWCEVYVEELEQWIAVDVIKGKVHSTKEIYNGATHPVCYVIGWDNNNYLKDLTRRYVPHWNTVTRKQRVEPQWWSEAIGPWLGPKTAKDKEEDEQLNRMQLEAPLPTSIGEYKNHPLYALKRHLLKFEAIYPPDAATLGFVRKEAVYARECVYVCRSRDTWLKEAKVVKLGEQPYKVVKARPKWDKLSNKLITDKPLEVFGPWQVQDYEPPVAENGVVPRNAYGNVELFKACMLPKGTVHVKLPGLNRVAKKLNIDCAPAMTGFDFNGGWSHPVYDGFVVCQEFEEIVTEAWLKDQEDQERREIEKLEARVYGNWKRLIKGLLIKERLKDKYGFKEPSTSKEKEKRKGPRLVVKK